MSEKEKNPGWFWSSWKTVAVSWAPWEASGSSSWEEAERSAWAASVCGDCQVATWRRQGSAGYPSLELTRGRARINAEVVCVWVAPVFREWERSLTAYRRRPVDWAWVPVTCRGWGRKRGSGRSQESKRRDHEGLETRGRRGSTSREQFRDRTTSPAVEAQSPRHQTTREVLRSEWFAVV